MYNSYNSKIDFNFEKKRYECKNFPAHVYFDSNIHLLPTTKYDLGNGNEIQFFDIENLPAYVLDFDGFNRLIDKDYVKYICVYKILNFDYYDKLFSVSEISSPISLIEFKSIFNEFVASEIKRIQNGEKFEFVPKEIPDIEDLIKVFALSHFKEQKLL